jgi:two-component system sensor histidine kinase DctS
MPQHPDLRGVSRLHAGVVGAAVAAYLVAAFWIRSLEGGAALFTHFAYLPVVLGGMFWGRRTVLLALALGAVPFAFDLVSPSGRGFGGDAVRGAMLVIVGASVGLLRDRLAASQRALIWSNDSLNTLVEKSQAGFFVERADRVVFVNSFLCRMLGYEPGELLGREVNTLVAPEDLGTVKRLVERRASGELHDLVYEARLLRKDGSPNWVEIASSAVDFEGAPAVVVNVYDLTARKEAEEKRREAQELARRQEEQLVHSTRLAEMGEMAAAVAHELNQPLTGIRNYARNAHFMLDQDAGDKEQVKDNLRLISEQVDRAAKIISQMRSLTRKSERQFALLDANGVVRDAVEFLMPHFRLAGVAVKLELDDRLPEVVGDRIRLEQVFLNVLTNARQAMERSPVRRLRVASRAEAGEKLPVVVEVADSGEGIAPDVATRMFEPFFSTKKTGTGLGLSISQSIVKDHRGTIEARGAPGEGAVFTVRLPLPPENGLPEGAHES